MIYIGSNVSVFVKCNVDYFAVMNSKGLFGYGKVGSEAVGTIGTHP